MVIECHVLVVADMVEQGLDAEHTAYRMNLAIKIPIGKISVGLNMSLAEPGCY